jgi:glycine/sarcosine N-methyltransferase
MYNELSEDYDRFVNWHNRLAIELPFIIKLLQQLRSRAILDAATGTGMHAIALAQHGFQAAGADISVGMVEQARRNATSAGVEVRFEVAPFGTLAATFGAHSFQAMLCLGNSLPHLLSQPDLDAALRDFAACLEPGGLLLVQNRNFDAVMSQHERWMEPQSHSEGDTEWIFQRFYDFDPDGLLTFNMVTLKRVEQGVWSQKVISSRLRPLLQDEIVSSMSLAGFSDIQSYGNMSGDPFDPRTSGNLVILAKININGSVGA